MQNRLREDLKTAMKSRNKVQVNTIRMLLSSIKNEQIRKGGDLSDDDYIGLLTREAKKRREAAHLFREGGRDEMANGEEAEFAIIQTYLPKALDESEVREIIAELVAQTGASQMAEMGKVMGPLMGRIRGKFDGKRASALVREALAS